MKKIGVIIPIYNTDKYLKQCIESVINQTYKNIEIALIDDGSTDDSGKICDEYAKKDNRIKVIHQKNSGKILARYNGAKILDSDYLTFVDSDDFIAPNTYETFTEQMEQNIDVIVWQIIRYFSKDKQIISSHNFPCGFYNNEQFKKTIYPQMIWIAEKDYFGIDPSLCNKLIKKDLVLKALKSAQVINVSCGDDTAAIYTMFRFINNIYLAKEALYYHRQRSVGNAPPYYRDKHFIHKLYELYNYLFEYYKDEPIFIKQLDGMFLHLLFSRNWSIKYPIKKFNVYPSLFPFNQIPANKNIILYGAGLVGRDYYKELISLNYANKLLWVDKNYEKYKDLGVKSVECLNEASDYDYVIVAIYKEEIARNIIEYLSNIPTLSKTKIIWSIAS